MWLEHLDEVRNNRVEGAKKAAAKLGTSQEQKVFNFLGLTQSWNVNIASETLKS